ncbi:MAG TPA: extracellular solute-binding protein [Trebonia sp.]|nr:extracellular solute-binding protein [Trebonia sp.]
MRRRRRHTSFISGTLAATAAIACLAVSACTPGVAGSTAASSSTPSGPVTTNPASLGNVTLSVLDYFTGGVDNTWMKDVIAAFEKKYPNITVQRQSVTWSDLMQELPLKLKSPNPPDIVPPNNGWQSLGTLVQGGLVDNLDSYAKAYGWDTSVPASILQEQEFSADGKQMGTGDLFGMPVALSSMIEVYYNRSLLQKLHLSVPTTYSDFVSDLAKAKAAGMTPIELGNQGQSGITQPLYSVMNALGDQSTISNIIYSQGQDSLTSQASGFPQAVQAMQQWASDGYFGKQFAGLPETNAETQFVQGQGLFHFDYSGSLPFTSASQAKGFGSFVMPRGDGKPAVATLSSATELCVSSQSKHVAAAAAFLNFAASPAAAQIAVNLGTDPMLAPNVSLPTSNPEFADEVANANLVTEHNSSVPYLDWATPSLFTTITVQMSEMLGGKTSVSSAVSAVQADDAKFRAQLGK